MLLAPQPPNTLGPIPVQCYQCGVQLFHILQPLPSSFVVAACEHHKKALTDVMLDDLNKRKGITADRVFEAWKKDNRYTS